MSEVRQTPLDGNTNGASRCAAPEVVTTFRNRDLLFFDYNYTKMPNSFVDLLLPLLADAKEFRAVSNIWRNTYGRRAQPGRNSQHNATWERVSGSAMGKRYGWKSLDPTKRGLSRSSATRQLETVVELGFLSRARFIEDEQTWEEPCSYGLGPEIFQMLATGDITWQLRANWNTELGESMPTYKPMHRGVVATEMRRDLVETRWFQFPNSFEDLVGPNMPIEVYPLLVLVLRHTLGKWQFAIDPHNPAAGLADERMRWFASRAWLADVLGISKRSVERYVKWARDNRILDVKRAGSYEKNAHVNGFLLGPEILHVLLGGDFTRGYRARNHVVGNPAERVFDAYAERYLVSGELRDADNPPEDITTLP